MAQLKTYGSVVSFFALMMGMYGCAPTTLPTPLPTSTPFVNLVLNPITSDVVVGETVALAVEANGQGLSFKWSSIRGTLSNQVTSAVIYTAPKTAGPDTVSVEVTISGSTVTKNVSFDVIALTATPTYTPTATPTPLPPTPPMPPPLETFPQAVNSEAKEFLFINNDAGLASEYVSDKDCVHAGSSGVKLVYDMVRKQMNAGWGWQWNDTKNGYFNASQSTFFTFWAKVNDGPGKLQVGLKSFKEVGKKDEFEHKVEVVVLAGAGWLEQRIELSRFEGVNPALVRNVNFGFNEDHAKGEICIDDIAFK